MVAYGLQMKRTVPCGFNQRASNGHAPVSCDLVRSVTTRSYIDDAYLEPWGASFARMHSSQDTATA